LLERIPSARELTRQELTSLRAVVAGSFVPVNQMSAQNRTRLLELGLIQNAMGGLMPTPAGKIVARL
jgi:hypothetical protein